MCLSKHVNPPQREQLCCLERAATGKQLFSSKNVDPSNASSKKTKGSIGAPRSSGMGAIVSGMYNVLDRDDTNDAIGKKKIANGIPFHVVRSSYYKEMLQAIAKIGPSYVPPGEHKLRTTILDRQVSKINVQKERMKQTGLGFWPPCCVHALNNALQDVEKIQWISNLVTATRDVQMFIYNHQTSLAMYSAHTRKEFLKPTDTRYASYFLLLERMLEVQAPLQSLVVRPMWGRWSESKTNSRKKVKLQVLDNDCWADCAYLVSFLGPLVEVIRYIDSNSPSLGEIYETFDSMLGRVNAAIQ